MINGTECTYTYTHQSFNQYYKFLPSNIILHNRKHHTVSSHTIIHQIFYFTFIQNYYITLPSHDKLYRIPCDGFHLPLRLLNCANIAVPEWPSIA